MVKRVLAWPDFAASTATTSTIDTYFVSLSRLLFHRGRRHRDKRRLLLDHQAGGRRAQRLGPPHGTAEVENRAGAEEKIAEGGGGGLPSRHQGPGHRRLCDPMQGASSPLRNWAELIALCVRGSGHSCRTSSSGRRASSKPAPAKSCAVSCARSPRTSWAAWEHQHPGRYPWLTAHLVANRPNSPFSTYVSPHIKKGRTSRCALLLRRGVRPITRRLPQQLTLQPGHRLPATP